MKKEEYEQMEQFEKKYWWHIGRRHILKKILQKLIFSNNGKKPLIIDFGCGTGGNFEILKKFGNVTGIDNSETAVKYCLEKKQSVRLTNNGHTPFLNGSVDLITALDVLEHIDNDIAAIKEFKRILKKNGKLIITVPAYRFLWSEHDEALGHRRRYLAYELKIKLNQTGFIVLKASYMVFFTFPIIFAYRLFRGIFPKASSKPRTSYIILPALANYFLVWTMKIESFLLNRMNLPFGCSIIIIAEKK